MAATHGDEFKRDAVRAALTKCSAPSKLDRLKLEFSANLPRLGQELKTMKASMFTEAQKAFILKQGEKGTSVAEICRKAGFGQSTYFA